MCRLTISGAASVIRAAENAECLDHNSIVTGGTDAQGERVVIFVGAESNDRSVGFTSSPGTGEDT
jgi:hypothetical protein